MTCDACGEKPKKMNKGFPKAVVEINNPESLVLLRKVVVPASMGDETAFPPAIGKYFNVLLHYDASGNNYLYSSDGIPTEIGANVPSEVINRIKTLEDGYDDLSEDYEQLQAQVGDISEDLSAETSARELADGNLQTQIDAITASSDVKDIVGTKAELNNYDTSTLGNNDIIKVLQDESENNATTYYRWNATTQQFTLIGEEGPYYTKAATDTLLNAKQDVLTAGTGIDITNNVISATGGGGTSDYEDLNNLPKVNNVTLKGNKSLSDLGIQPAGDYALESEIPDVSNFITNTVDNLVNYYKKSETFTKQEVNDLISAITTMDIQVVQTLPTEDISTTTIYLVPKATAGTNDAYDEYIYVSNAWEHIGSTDIDLSGYQTKIDSSHKLSSDLVDDANQTNKFVTTSEKQTWNNKLDESDLSDYVKNTDYATAEKGGTIRTSNASGLGISNGNLYAVTKTYNTYNSASDNMFIGKGTLENVIAGKELVTNQDISGKANKISVVQTSASTIEINPNTFYKFGEVASLNITLASITDNTIYNEYMFEFVSGTTATTLTLPSSIKWLETPTIDANKIYQCSIVDNIGILVGVANV